MNTSSPSDNRQSPGQMTSGQEAHAGCGCTLPEVTFSTFILSLASSALVQLGEVPNPEDGSTSQDLVMAKHSIDILTMLEAKTRSCLDDDEARLLDGLLYELRMKYVMKKVD